MRLNVLADKLGELTLSLAGTAEGASRLARSGEAASRRLLGSTLPRVDAAIHELERAARSVDALARQLREQPQSLIQGRSRPPPGPGEEGYPADGDENRARAP
jgi:phospholipid/cholesterol/gamma-HCH transport system substrate-binding protein